MKLIDTSVWIRALRRRPHATFYELVHGLIGRSEAAINGTIAVELLVGALDEREYTGLQDELSGVANFPTTDHTWQLAAELGFRLRRAGFPTPVPDLTIAASAIEHGIVLVHADSDFDRIAAHSELQVESYVSR